MTALQKYCEKLLCEEGTPDHERSILLVDIMNVLGFSKIEREIHRHRVHLWNALGNMFLPTDKGTVTLTGSISEGICGGIYSNKTYHDHDMLFTASHIKLYTPRTKNANNTPVLVIRDNADYKASFFVEEDDKFPGYVKLSFAGAKNKYLDLVSCLKLNDNKLYLSSSMIMDVLYKLIDGSWEDAISLDIHRFLNPGQTSDINGPAHTRQAKDYRGNTMKIDFVLCIHHDMWPKSASSFITRCYPNYWPSNSMLENIQSQGCDEVPVGHYDSQNNDIQWRISFPGE